MRIRNSMKVTHQGKARGEILKKYGNSGLDMCKRKYGEKLSE